MATAAANLSVGHDPEIDRSYLDGEDVSTEIRGNAVTAAVSAVSSVPAARQVLAILRAESEAATRPSVRR